MTKYQVIEIPPDGNCQFTALNYSIFGEMDAAHMRKQITSYLPIYFENQKLEEIPVEINNDDFKTMTIKKYIKWMSKDGIWGDQYTLAAASILFNKKIVIYDFYDTNRFNEISINLDAREAIHLLRVNNNHYDVLVKPL